jgi:hypothetical protein
MNQLFENYSEETEYSNLNEAKANAIVKLAKGLTKKGKKLAKNLKKKTKKIIHPRETARKEGLKKGLIYGGAGAAAVGTGAYVAGKKSGSGSAKLSPKNKKKLNEALEYGISKNQFLFDAEVLSNLRNISESENIDYLEARNNYLGEQRDSALEYEFEDAAVYYNEKML